MTDTLNGKVAIVTGSSSGIGRATAERLAADGAAVVINYARSADKAQEVVAGIEAAGGRAIALQADLSKVDEVRSLFAQAEEQLGAPDIFVSNAGTAQYKPLVDFTEEEFDRTFALNARGVFFALQEAAKRLNKGGRIVVVSSSATKMAAETSSAYSGSKAAAEQFAMSLSKELGARDITVNVVSPGITDTGMLAEVGEQFREMGMAMSPLGRIGQPIDIAGVIAFLASDDGGWLTGQNLQAGGGIIRSA